MRFFAFVRYWREKGGTMRWYSSCSWTSRKPMIYLGRKYSTVFP
jgi:hypothetical protein